MDKLLIVADQDSAGYATPRGLELARKLGRRPEVVAFTYAPLKALNVSKAEAQSMRERLLEDRRATVQARIDKHAEQGEAVKLHVVWEKNIETWITRQCAAGKYGSVLKTGNRSETIVHNSTDWELLRNCPVPVLLVCDKRWHRAKPVMVALDLSTKVASKKALNDKVLAAASAMAKALAVDLEIVAAIEIPTLLADLDLVDPIAYVNEQREAMQPEIRRLAARFDIPESAFYCKRGPIEKVITSRAAKVRAQVVVMGTVGRKGVRARLMGNTAEKVLRHLRTDVLAIKP